MCVTSEGKISDTSKLSSHRVGAIDASFNSLVIFLDELLKCIHDTLQQLENYYEMYLSAVHVGIGWNISTNSSKEQKKIDSKYNFIKKQLEEFLNCIVQDYGEFIQDAYEIRALNEKYDYYINYLQQISLDNHKSDELNTLIPQVDKMKKQIDKLVLQYNADITKVSYLKLNLRYRVIAYRSSFSGRSFSIPINVLLRNFRNLIRSNRLIGIANELPTFQQQPPSNLETEFQQPESIVSQTLTPFQEQPSSNIQDSSLPPPSNIEDYSQQPPSNIQDVPQSPPSHIQDLSQPPPSNLQDSSHLPELVYTRPIDAIQQEQPPSNIQPELQQLESIVYHPPASLLEQPLSNLQALSQLPELIYARSVNLDPLLVNKTRGEHQQPSQPESAQERTRIGGITTPVAKPASISSSKKRSIDQTTLQGAQPQSLREDKPDKRKKISRRKDSSDTTKSTVKSDILSTPNLAVELMEVESVNSSSTSGSSIQSQPRENIVPEKLKKKFELKRASSSSKMPPIAEERLEQRSKKLRVVPMKAKKSISKRNVSQKPLQELIEIHKQKLITEEFLENMNNILNGKIEEIEKYENEKIIHNNSTLCTKYNLVQDQFKNEQNILERIKRKKDEKEQLGINSPRDQEDLAKIEQSLNETQSSIGKHELKINEIKNQVKELDNEDYNLQLSKRSMYKALYYLYKRWLKQVDERLETETDNTKIQQLQKNRRFAIRKLINIREGLKDFMVSYQRRTMKRKTIGPYKDYFCNKDTFNVSLKRVIEKYSKHESNEPERRIPSDAPTNVLIPRRKPNTES